MQKAVFMSNRVEAIDRVYSKETVEKLKSELEFYSEIVNLKNIEQYKDFLAETEFIFTTWGMLQLSAEDIEKYLPKVKAVFYGAGSVQYFAKPFLESGIKISSAWVSNGYPVVEFTISQVLLANKGYFRIVQEMKKTRSWSAAGQVANEYNGNYKAKVGILGAGAIGGRVAELLAPFDLELYAFDPFMSEEKARKLNVKKTSLEYIFENCDVISNHIANLPETVGMIDKRHFNLMKDNATFINTGRGQQLIEADLIAALKEKPSRTALLDVTDPEPPAQGNELYTLPNVFMTPHIAGSVNGECHRMGETMYEEFTLFRDNGELKYEVTLEMLKTMA